MRVSVRLNQEMSSGVLELGRWLLVWRLPAVWCQSVVSVKVALLLSGAVLTLPVSLPKVGDGVGEERVAAAPE